MAARPAAPQSSPVPLQRPLVPPLVPLAPLVAAQTSVASLDVASQSVALLAPAQCSQCHFSDGTVRRKPYDFPRFARNE